MYSEEHYTNLDGEEFTTVTFSERGESETLDGNGILSAA